MEDDSNYRFSQSLMEYGRSIYTEQYCNYSFPSQSLIFSTEEAEQLFALSFTRHARTGEDGVKMM